MHRTIIDVGKISSRNTPRRSENAAGYNFFNANLIRFLYNQSMEKTDYVFGIMDIPVYLSAVRDAFDLGNSQQQSFVRKVYDALFRAVPREKQFLFEDYSFDAYISDDRSVVIEYITPELYFSIDIEEKPVNSSWTFSVKKNDGSRVSRGDFFNDKYTVSYVIPNICSQMIQWMEYGWIS